jgi:formylglycine-generating enzyme required for sulfatase activity
MVVLPAGDFMMGSNDGAANEKPVHRVTVAKPFAVGKFEVTFAEWDACVSDAGCKRKPNDQGWGRDKRPVINVSWEDITNEYLPWLKSKTGKTYRLLTEAEWEYAARAGSRDKYTWGDEIGKNRANCDGCASQWDGWKQTAPVGFFQPNAFGLHDMHGNVWEWVADCYEDNYASALSDGNEAICTSQYPLHTYRGGSWVSIPRFLRAATRNKALSYQSVYQSLDLGFRVARTLGP